MTANSLDSTVGENHFLLGDVLLGLVKSPEERMTPKEAINNLKMASNYFYNSKNYGYKLTFILQECWRDSYVFRNQRYHR